MCYVGNFMEIPLFKIYWDKKDTEGVREVIESGLNWAIGPKVEEFENALAQYIGRRYAVCFNSGTSALYALMLALGIGPGDEVIAPSFTFIATANAPLFVGATPVFAEIEQETFGLDPKDVEKKITEKTKAIIAVHYAGSPCQIKELKEIAQKHNLILIEDAAESLGAKLDSKMTGVFGKAAVLSFCANKIISTGEGGAVVIDDEEIYEKLKLIRSHGRQDKENYFASVVSPDYVSLGYNFRMPNILAALGQSQLAKIEDIIEKRRANSRYLTDRLKDVKNILLPGEPADSRSVFQLYTIRVRQGGKIRDDLQNYLKEKGIATKVYFPPIHLSKFYQQKFGFKPGDLPITEQISDDALTLPMYPVLTGNEMDYIAEQVSLFFQQADVK